MDSTLQIISIYELAIAFIPVLLVIVLLYKWSLGAGEALYSIIRMLIQLILVGYVLVFIFESEDVWITSFVILIMILVSSWISLRATVQFREKLFWKVVLSSVLGGGSVLFLTVWIVLELNPIFKPQYTIPLAGMVFANSMNTISLALERLNAELKNKIEYTVARNTAFHAALIPMINTMFAVGIVSLPGMMTGQVLSGVSPLIAVRYQILIMCMIFSSAAISTACLLVISRKSLLSLR